MNSSIFNVLTLAASLDNCLFTFDLSHLISPSLLLLVSDGLLGTLAGTGVGLGPLAVDGQAAAMTQAAIAADFGQPLDVHRGLSVL